MKGKTDEPTILFCFVSSESSVHVNINLNADMLPLENLLLISKGLMVVLKKCCSSILFLCNSIKQTQPFIRFNCYSLLSLDCELLGPGPHLIHLYPLQCLLSTVLCTLQLLNKMLIELTLVSVSVFLF